MIALLDAHRAGLLRREHWMPNVVAGVIVGVVALPLAMAFAIASGAKPEQGLYTAIVAGLIVSAFGGSRLQIAGPTGAFIVILAFNNARASSLVNTVGKRAGFFARVTSDNQGKSTSNSSRYKNSSADNAWFWVEAVTFRSTASEVRNASISALPISAG